MSNYVSLAIFIGFFALFFLAIVLTLVLGGISRMGDKRLALEERARDEQRLPGSTDRPLHA
jgi:hypothetical protein